MRKKVVALYMSLMMALVLIIPTRAEEPGKNQKSDGNVIQVCEIEGLRTKSSETFLLSDGTYDCVVYSENKYFEDGGGNLVPIDNTVVETRYSFNEKDYRYKNSANETDFYFTDKEPTVLASYDGRQLVWSLIGAKTTKAIPGGSEKTKQVWEYALSGKNYIAYPDVADNTELVYAVHNGSVKEYIVLENAAAPTEFVFRFENAGYHVGEIESGRLAFFDENQEQVFDTGSLYAIDATGKYTDQLHYEVKEYNENSTIIAIKLSEEYANDPERVFPILIDPSIMITNYDSTYDTFVSSKFPTTNYCEDNHLRTGYDDDLYVRRTYMRFIMPSYLYVTAYYSNISNARIRIKQYIGTSPEVKAYRVTGNWVSSNLTWNNKPSYTTTGCSALATQESDNWYSLNITNIIKNQLNGTYGDYGVMLKDNTESGTSHWTTFYSSEASSPNKPELHITYSSVPAKVFYTSSFGIGKTIQIKNTLNNLGYSTSWVPDPTENTVKVALTGDNVVVFIQTVGTIFSTLQCSDYVLSPSSIVSSGNHLAYLSASYSSHSPGTSLSFRGKMSSLGVPMTVGFDSIIYTSGNTGGIHYFNWLVFQKLALGQTLQNAINGAKYELYLEYVDYYGADSVVFSGGSEVLPTSN